MLKSPSHQIYFSINCGALFSLYHMMERIFLNSSLKDIPIPGRDTYLRLLIAKTNSFIRRLRWVIFHKETRVKKSNVRVITLKEQRLEEMKGLFKSKRNPPFNDQTHSSPNMTFQHQQTFRWWRHVITNKLSVYNELYPVEGYGLQNNCFCCSQKVFSYFRWFVIVTMLKIRSIGV